MNFPGANTLVLTNAALCAAIEGALNAARKDGEDYVRVTNVTQEYSYSTTFKVELTTDAPAKAEPVVHTMMMQVA